MPPAAATCLKIFARVIPGFSLERPNMTQWTLASRAAKMNSSAIREILKLTDRPGIISMAGGLPPSPQTFPISAFQAACNTVLERDGAAALQYSTTEGLPALGQAVADFLPWDVDAEQVCIVSGSQQALDLIGKIFLDKDSRLLVERPTYLGAFQAFAPMEPIAAVWPATIKACWLMISPLPSGQRR